MIGLSDMKIEKCEHLKVKPEDSKLVFGSIFADHMFEMDWDEDSGWHSPRIGPYASFSVDPAMATLHYGQAVFEGLKAFRQSNNSIVLFRPMDNMRRLNSSCRRLCIPEVDEGFLLSCIKELIKIEADWVPRKEGCSLYVRPFVFATESFLGVRPSKAYKLMVILSPVGAYYSSGFAPVKILVCDQYTRASKGGTGEAKASGNYAASLKAAEEAHEKGHTQVLWLDSAEKKYVEEVGTMNIFFYLNDEIVTPPLSGSILPGVTRASVLELSQSWGIKTDERAVSINDIFQAGDNSTLMEIFGTGTACVISAVGELKYDKKIWKMPEWIPGPIAQKLFDEITGIQYGHIKDKFGWIESIV